MSKFMTIEKDEDKHGIEYHLYSKKDKEHLGFIELNEGWKKWIFNPDECTIYDAECLKDIIEWLDEIKDKKM